MPNETPFESPMFGYLTVVDDPAHGACGGYLVINQQGRPVEFHCTAAVAPSRAQQILYGPTLRASLYGEQIGPALIAKSKSPVVVVFVNQCECLELNCQTELQVVLISEAASAAKETDSRQLCLFPELKEGTLATAPSISEEVKSLLRKLAETIEIAEPFERIREAIFEAQQIGGEGQESDARAA